MAKKKRPRAAQTTESALGLRTVGLFLASAAVVALVGWWMVTSGPLALVPEAGSPVGTGSAGTAGAGETGSDAGQSNRSAPTAAVSDLEPSSEASGPSDPAPGPLEPTSGAPTPALEPGAWTTVSGHPVLGSPTAPVKIVEYADYQCSNCRGFAVEILPWMRETWVRRGYASVESRDFAILGAESTRAAEAAHCAGEQGRFWSYHEELFRQQSGQNQGVFSDSALRAIASDLGLDSAAFAECLSGGRYRARVDASTQLAVSEGYEGTPVFEINGRAVQGAITKARWEELFTAYEEEIAQATVEDE